MTSHSALVPHRSGARYCYKVYPHTVLYRLDCWNELSFSVTVLAIGIAVPWNSQFQDFYRRVFKVTFVTVRSWGLGLRSISIEGRERVVKHSLLIEFCTDLAWEGMVRVKRETKKSQLQFSIVH